MKSKVIIQELEQIADNHNGLLRAADVIEFARSPETALHTHFEWDDTEAARQYRLEQARKIIRMTITVFEREKTQTKYRMFVSLESDRVQPDGGYRFTEVVLSDSEKRMELLRQAKKDAQLFQQKYRTLKELAPIFDAIDRIPWNIEETVTELVAV